MIEDGTIATARVAVGGVGTIPWRAREAEAILTGATVDFRHLPIRCGGRDPGPVHGSRHGVQGRDGQANDRANPADDLGSRAVTTAESNTIAGAGVDRVDGPLKVTGAAPLPVGLRLPRASARRRWCSRRSLLGRSAESTTEDAEASPGVLAVVTHKNAPALADGPMTPLGPSPATPLRDNRIVHHGQHVAVVVAQTPEQATAAARSVRIEYQQSTPILAIANPRRGRPSKPVGTGAAARRRRGRAASAEVLYDETFATAAETNNPMGLFATVGVLGGEPSDRARLQPVARDGHGKTLAAVFDLAESDVRVLVPYLGGGFGAGLRAWPHVHPRRARGAAGAPAGQARLDPPADVHLHWAPRAVAATRAARVWQETGGWWRSTTRDLHAGHRGLQYRSDHDGHGFRVCLPERRYP